ncbi:MAG: maleylpyruvate isomerase N-terminal domain-containing protein [Terracidiphilus sp.]|jgi:hypothetical protein
MIDNYAEVNETEYKRLADLLASLSDDDLKRTLPNGWSVADVLAHLAFWDAYAVACFQEWGRSGFKSPAAQYDAINQAVDGISRLIPSAELRRWVLEIAQASNRAAADASPEVQAAIQAAGRDSFLRRSKHRSHHLDQIVALLGRS